jgi:hypothetical protein
MRFRKETIEWKDDSTNLSKKEQVVVSRLRTGYTQATRYRKNAITRMARLRGVVDIRTHTMGVYGNNERERRETGTTKEVWTAGT